MPERLGEALLDLRTNDAAFNAGIAQAEGRAQKLGSTLDKTSGSSAKLAGEMVATGRSAQVMGAGFEAAGSKVRNSAEAQRAGMQQLGFQLGDIATMYSLGARPAQIFGSQIGQVTQAVQLMAGGTSRVAAFLGGPWGLAITSAIVVLTPFIGKLFESETALKGVELATSNLSDVQSILSRVINSTTGQINAQTTSTLALARAQIALARVQATGRQVAARSEMQSIRQGGVGDLRVEGTMGGLRVVRASNGQDVVDAVVRGRLTGEAAERQLRARMDSGLISPSAYERASSAVLNYDIEGGNIQRLDTAQRALDGDTAAARSLLGPQGAGTRGGGNRAGQRGPQPRSEAAITADFDARGAALAREELQSRLALATSADDRADIQNDLRNLEREQRVAEIEATDLGRERKDALIAQVTALLGFTPQLDEQGNLLVSANLGLEGQIIARDRAAQREQEAEALADERFNILREGLQLQLGLADTEAERKDLALRLLDAEDAYVKSKLEAVILSATANDAERQRAQLALDALNASEQGRRALVARQNETGTERYLRNLNQTPGQINEALEGIQIDGLESLNDGLTQAILGAESLGDVFSRVADQIIADLLRIAIQQAIIKPLANALFGGGAGGGGGGGLLGSLFGGEGGGLFAGLFAAGGTIPTGKFGIVGEDGPELAFAGSGGLGILSNSDSRKALGGAGGTSVPINISIDATGADAAAIARLNSRLDRLSAELPGKIITTVQDASNRRIIKTGGGR